VTRVESVRFAGDFFDRVAHPDGGLTLIMADVFRRGVDAMRLGESVRGLFQAHARYHRSPAEIVARIHDALVRHHPDAYAALWIAGISPNGQLTSCSAGNPPAFCLPTDGGAGQRLALGGPPVGVHAAPFPYREDRLRLLPGDAVVAVSDGLLDSANAAGVSFGEGRVEDLLNENRRQPLDQIVDLLCEEARRFARGIQPVDDIVGLALRFSREE
jgi:serine phosphatase RsbU (regulator of sigma subunit)